MAADENMSTEDLITLTSEIVAAHVSKNNVELGSVPELISSVYAALAQLGNEAETEEVRPKPAVSVRASVNRDHLICLEDGKKMKTLKRHLMSEHGMTPEEYRRRWGLSSDYPMIAADYAERRRDLAAKIGLGRKRDQKRGRRKKA